MIVDSTALPEQVVADIVTSAFRSAGQRCSALRLLVLQEDIAERTLEMLGRRDGHCCMVGDPADPATDVGPVIDRAAYDRLMGYRARRASALGSRRSPRPPPACSCRRRVIRLDRDRGADRRNGSARSSTS